MTKCLLRRSALHLSGHLFRRGALHSAGAALAAILLSGGAHAADVSPSGAGLKVCVDSASATAARDKAVAGSVAKQAGIALTVIPFDGGADDDGVPAKQFRALLTTQCDLVMGYPVDTTQAVLPPGILATRPYAQTGFVLVTAAGQTAHDLADLPAGTEIAVTYETAPNLYFVDHANLRPDVHRSDTETLQAVADGTVKAAMVWQPTVENYKAQHPGAAHLSVYPLNEPHARYNVVALYLPQGSHSADTFNATKISLATPAPGTGSAAPPALYTDAQAKIGYAKFLGNCAMCHGAHLEGRAGPGLKGPNWANAKADYTVGEVFTVVSQQMPATSPGSLDPVDYVQIMAFLLQQNGYPAGSKALGFDDAAASKVPLLYRGG